MGTATRYIKAGNVRKHYGNSQQICPVCVGSGGSAYQSEKVPCPAIGGAFFGEDCDSDAAGDEDEQTLDGMAGSLALLDFALLDAHAGAIEGSAGGGGIGSAW